VTFVKRGMCYAMTRIHCVEVKGGIISGRLSRLGEECLVVLLGLDECFLEEVGVYNQVSVCAQ
jgi:hypothetical protein